MADEGEACQWEAGTRYPGTNGTPVPAVTATVHNLPKGTISKLTVTNSWFYVSGVHISTALPVLDRDTVIKIYSWALGYPGTREPGYPGIRSNRDDFRGPLCGRHFFFNLKTQV
eukprot:982310-Rhodomonas_salina.1